MCITQPLAARWRQVDFQTRLQPGNQPLAACWTKARRIGIRTAAQAVGQRQQWGCCVCNAEYLSYLCCGKNPSTAKLWYREDWFSCIKKYFLMPFYDFQQKIVIAKHTRCVTKIKGKTPNMFRNLIILHYFVQDIFIIFLYYSVINQGASSVQAVPNFNSTVFIMIIDIYPSVTLGKNSTKGFFLCLAKLRNCMESHLQDLRKWGDLGLAISQRSLFFCWAEQLKEDSQLPVQET